jgi:hypothetical protein
MPTLQWNNLNHSVRNLDSLSKFKKAIRSSISMPIARHYSHGPRKLNIILTQLRYNASFLNYDWCKVKILSNASCNCGAPCENSHHFFFDCDKYTDNREILFNSLNWLPSNINIDVNLLKKEANCLPLTVKKGSEVQFDSLTVKRGSEVQFDPRPAKYRNSASYNDYFRNICLNHKGVSKFPIS